MIIAQRKRRENIVEYLLYMWQVEDLIRASDLSLERVEALILQRYQVDEPTRAEIRQWYSELIDMMRSEGKAQSGHLNITTIVLMQLEELNRRLLANPNDYVYSGLHLQILPALIELRGKNGQRQEGEVETALNAVYGYVTLALQGRQVSPETRRSMEQISAYLAMLAHRFRLEEEGRDLTDEAETPMN